MKGRFFRGQRVVLVGLALSGTQSLVGTANAALVHQYDANVATPAPQPDSAAGGGFVRAGANQAVTTTAAGTEMGTNSWNIIDDNFNENGAPPASVNSSLMYNRDLSPAQLTDPAGWWARVVVRVPSASATTSGTIFHVRTDTDTTVTAATGEYYGIAFVNDGVSEYVGYVSGATGAPIVKLGDVELDSAYVTVDADYDPATQAVTVYYNGVAFADVITTDETSNTGQALFGFGSNTSAATGEHHWARAEFHTGAIPEPTSLAMIGGIAGLALSRRWRSKSVQPGERRA